MLRWLTYFEGLLNTKNTRKQIESGVAIEEPIELFKENEVFEQGIGCVVEAMNQVLQQGIPEIWCHSMKLWERS